ncbi:MAG: NADH-quinone oxidoreductase subunit NuoK [Gemmatimonadetes bacterium]|nr:NADH-quinone oxidoreductase subunit NuoK [Gemmatimonadota bacterium]
MIGLVHYLVFAGILFCLGLFAVLTRRNAVTVLMGIELMLNAGNVNLVAFNRFVGSGVNGQIFALFIIVLAAAEAAVALAILLNIYRTYKHITVDEIHLLRG